MVSRRTGHTGPCFTALDVFAATSLAQRKPWVSEVTDCHSTDVKLLLSPVRSTTGDK